MSEMRVGAHTRASKSIVAAARLLYTRVVSVGAGSVVFHILANAGRVGTPSLTVDRILTDDAFWREEPPLVLAKYTAHRPTMRKSGRGLTATLNVAVAVDPIRAVSAGMNVGSVHRSARLVDVVVWFVKSVKLFAVPKLQSRYNKDFSSSCRTELTVSNSGVYLVIGNPDSTWSLGPG